jgi:hypothetical protein
LYIATILAIKAVRVTGEATMGEKNLDKDRWDKSRDVSNSPAIRPSPDTELDMFALRVSSGDQPFEELF